MEITSRSGAQNHPQPAMAAPEHDVPLWIERARTALAGAPIGHAIHYFSSIPSTMPAAHALIGEQGKAAGAVVVADEQTAGRGRRQRGWAAPSGRALLSSVVVAGNLLPTQPAQLPMIAGLALIAAVRQICPAHTHRLRLKWPNDLIVLDAAGVRKLAGILIESTLQGGSMAYAIVGIGINVTQRQDELPLPRPGGLLPGSLYTVTGRTIDRADLLVALCRSLGDRLAGKRQPTPEAIHRRWQAELYGIGRNVVVTTPQGQHHGRLAGTTRTGGLVLETLLGTRLSVEAGDVEIVWPSANCRSDTACV